MKQKVLLVEHSQPVHSLVKSRLSDEPIELHSAFTADTAVQMIAQVQPDLILLDADLPHRAGFDLCRQIKADAATSAVPVIFLTSATSAAQKLEGLEAGAADFISKPFDAAELRARIRTALRTKFLMDLLATKAMVDGLTGLWNRAYVEHRIAAELATVHRTGRSFGCIIADVDNFKSINGRFGHPFGDEVLRTIAIHFVEDCRTEDIVCRYGGDRFAIITPGVDAPRASILAERLRRTVEELTLSHNGQPVRITCSFGVAGSAARSPITPIPIAEDAATQAKTAGGNQVICAASAAAVANLV
jgi:diguanylate cyclase (GGDEF)-like protein